MLYPFGYGLSYSDFAYEKIESFKQDKKNIRVTVSVKNTSGRDGEEVVQLYASYPESKVERPSKYTHTFASPGSLKSLCSISAAFMTLNTIISRPAMGTMM